MGLGGRGAGGVAAAAILFAVLLPAQASASAIETIAVNTTDDKSLAENPSYCDPEEPGGEACPLRAAVELASQNATRGATSIEIVVPEGKYVLSNGELKLGNAFPHACFEGSPCPVTLAGAGAGKTILEGDGQREIEAVEHAAPIAIEDVTMQGGADTAGGALRAKPGGGVTIKRSVLTKNDGHSGGAIFSLENPITVVETVISENTSEHAGAVYQSGAAFEAVRSTLSGNASIASGGALRLETAAATIVDSTISGNEVTGGGLSGGAIFGEGGAAIRVKYSTIAGNVAPVGGGIAGFESLRLEGSILSGNSGAQCIGAGTTETAGANIVFGSSSCPVAKGPTPLGVDPLLAPLGINGGFAPTRALGRGSPAVNAAGASCAGARGVDERGYARPLGAGCDLGAFEAAGDAAVTLAAAPEPATVGGGLSLTAAASNRGSEPVGAVSVTVTLPPATAFVAAPLGCVVTIGVPTTVSCPVGSLAPGQSYAVTVKVRPELAGALLESASVSAEQADFDPADDSATLASAVINPAPGGGGGGSPRGVGGPTGASALLGRTFTLDRHGNLTLHVTCPAASSGGCRDHVSLYTSSGSLPAAAARRARLLASTRAAIAAGAHATIRLHLSASARRLFTRRGGTRARLRLVARQANGLTSSVYAVMVKPPVAAHHH